MTDFGIINAVVLEDTALASENIVVTVSDGSTDRIFCTPIPIVNDNALEGRHGFMAEIISAGMSPHASLGTLVTTAIDIIDDESK